ncbi:MAG: TIGR00159 family protein [Crocinitomicaceae bacterium]|nr:TIGR00159 family protein [Crocinitomicaceae bacterium]|tara:strand:- start:343 stop:1161 length:819 start_codon:yes stop_codon:yes gene_type:complete
MSFIYETWELIQPFYELGIKAFDYLLVGLIILWIYKLTKGTSAIPVFLGLLAIYLIWKVVTFAGMPILAELLGQFIGVGIIAIIIVFQQELRQFLFSIGERANIKGPTKILEKIVTFRHEAKSPFKINEVTTAVNNLSKRKDGALLIIQRNSDLSIHFHGSTPLVADLYAPLIEASFDKNCSMHDGGMYIAIGRIRAVKCILPVSQRTDLSQELGMRHRAALGLVEKTDALVLIVSEETGLISIAMDGKLHKGLASEDIQEILERELIPKED